MKILPKKILPKKKRTKKNPVKIPQETFQKYAKTVSKTIWSVPQNPPKKAPKIFQKSAKIQPKKIQNSKIPTKNPVLSSIKYCIKPTPIFGQMFDLVCGQDCGDGKNQKYNVQYYLAPQKPTENVKEPKTSSFFTLEIYYSLL